mgnify:CR=1 FL=1
MMDWWMKYRQWFMAVGLAFAILGCVWLVRTISMQQEQIEENAVHSQIQAWLASSNPDYQTMMPASEPTSSLASTFTIAPLEHTTSNNVTIQPPSQPPTPTPYSEPSTERAVEVEVSPLSSAGGQADSKVVNINTANEGQLTTLPGIGPSKAKAIIAYREQKGGFKTKHELTKVKGIGEKTYLKLQALISVS